MSKSSIMLKGNKYGIIIVMDKDASLDCLKQDLTDKLKESAKFFGKGTLAVTFEGKTLSDDEQKELLNVISENSELNIACVIDENEEIVEVFKKSVEKIQNLVDNEDSADKQAQKEKEVQFMEQMLEKANHDDGNTGKFYRGTLRSGQVLESDTSIVVIGDVNPGAKVCAGGNIIILGSLKGNVFAGKNGDKNSFVVALDMSPVQIRIGDVIASCPERPKRAKVQTKIAYLDQGAIFIDPLSRDILNELKF